MTLPPPTALCRSLCPSHFVATIRDYIPPWISEIQRESLMQKFDLFRKLIGDGSFQVVDGVPFPDVNCCEAMMPALRQFINLLDEDQEGKCPVKYKEAIGLSLQEVEDILDHALMLYDYCAGPESLEGRV
ncbi:uncharacterized protein N7473_011066 [Penicillium subrubescens]|uniref:uncharacterized protein n=1 Tax=Penicillium subrubescens TaxID=1316194 RepID=UPI00254515F0|nr:uncharacterized protein N7473_011066 [Penicillium subrubescens]KAJ5882804.1 hypothetical protein N7473_011066 [Penicillium subrubescens]